MTYLKSLALSLPVVLAGATVHAAVVDFGGVAEGTDVVGSFDYGGGLTGSISSSHLGSNATGDVVVCDTSTVGSACRRNDPDLRSDFNAASGSDVDLGLYDFGNALILEEAIRGANPDPNNVDDASQGGRITFSFDQTITLFSLAILDGADNSPTGATIFLDGIAYDSGRGGNDNEYDILKFGDSGVRVSSFSVDFAGSGAIGEFSAVVPLPASALLLLGGLGALGAMRRRKQT